MEKVPYSKYTQELRLEAVRLVTEGSQPEKPIGGGKVILLFGKCDRKTTQSAKRAHGDVP